MSKRHNLGKTIFVRLTKDKGQTWARLGVTRSPHVGSLPETRHETPLRAGRKTSTKWVPRSTTLTSSECGSLTYPSTQRVYYSKDSSVPSVFVRAYRLVSPARNETINNPGPGPDLELAKLEGRFPLCCVLKNNRTSLRPVFQRPLPEWTFNSRQFLVFASG